jgi:nucleoid DNA-binding protein
MNKVELIRSIATITNSTHRESAEILQAVTASIVEGIVNDGECVLPGIGKLKVRQIPARSGVAMGVPWHKPAHKKVKLLLSKSGRTLGN